MLLRKMLITAAATATLSVPLAALASADPSADNQGVPGSLGGATPGSEVKSYNQAGQPFGPPGPLLGAQHGFSLAGQQQGK